MNNDSLTLNEQILRKLLSPDHSDNDNGEFLYKKLQKSPHLRKSLAAINNARAFKYGTRAFGNKKWYKENFDTTEGLKTNEDRRKFRFGLKTNIDFLIQLDLLNLRTQLRKTSFNPQGPTQTLPQSLSDGSFLHTMHHIDAQRCAKFCEILDRMSDNLEFSQSLSEYFATDDMLEPALMLIAESLRRDPNLRKNLHGGSFASNAMVYRHRASPRDHDMNFKRPIKSSPRTTIPTKKQKTSMRDKKGFGKYTYGYCFRFQHTGSCDRPDCEFLHKCNSCDGSHGEESCPDK